MGFKLIKDDYKVYKGVKLYRIVATEDIYQTCYDGYFKIVSKGDTGGFVEGEWNLDTCRGSWIADDSVAFGDALIHEGAVLMHNAIVKDTEVRNWCVIDGIKVAGDGVIKGGDFERSIYLNEDSVYDGKFLYTRKGKDVSFYEHDKLYNAEGAILNYFGVIDDEDMTEDMIQEHLNCYEQEDDDDMTPAEEAQYWDEYLDKKINEFGSYDYFDDCYHNWSAFAR